MPTPFDALDAMMTKTVRNVFGEMFQIIPYLYPADDVDGEPILDTTRPVLVVSAEYVAQMKSTPLPARGAMQDDNAHSYTTAHPAIHVDDVDLLWRPVRGCRVLRVATGELWQIQRPPRQDGFGHTCIPLTNKVLTEVTP